MNKPLMRIEAFILREIMDKTVHDAIGSEREACAQLAGSKRDHCDCPISVADIISAAIRARGKQ